MKESDLIEIAIYKFLVNLFLVPLYVLPNPKKFSNVLDQL